MVNLKEIIVFNDGDFLPSLLPDTISLCNLHSSCHLQNVSDPLTLLEVDAFNLKITDWKRSSPLSKQTYYMIFQARWKKKKFQYFSLPCFEVRARLGIQRNSLQEWTSFTITRVNLEVLIFSCFLLLLQTAALSLFLPAEHIDLLKVQGHEYMTARDFILHGKFNGLTWAACSYKRT